MQRSQTATEYLIILAVVIVIALIVVGVLGGIPGIGTGTSERQKKIGELSNEISISSYAVYDCGTKLTLRNNNPFTVQITRVIINNTACSTNDLPASLAVGESIAIDCAGICSNLGSRYSYLVNVTWKQVSSSGGVEFTQSGSKIEGIVGINTTGGGSNNNNEENDQSTCDLTCQSLQSGLLGYFPCDTDFNDNSSNQNDATPHGNIQITNSSKVGLGACTFDGIDDYLSVSDDVFDIENITIAFWFKTNGQASQKFMVSKHSSGSENGYFVGYDWEVADAVNFYYSGTPSRRVSSGNGFDDSSWHFVAAIKTNSRHSLRTDSYGGETTGGGTYSPNSESLTIGGLPSQPNYFDGEIDEVAVWNRELTNIEVDYLYNNGNGRSFTN